MSIYNKIKLVSGLLAAVLLSDFLLRISGRDSFILPDSSAVINIEIVTTILLTIFICIEIGKAVYRKNYKLAICMIAITLSVVQISRHYIHSLTNKSISEAKDIVFSYISGSSSKKLSINIDDDAKEVYIAYIRKSKHIGDLTLTTYAPHLRIYEFKVCPSGSRCFSIRLMAHQSKPCEIWIHG